MGRMAQDSRHFLLWAMARYLNLKQQGGSTIGLGR
jgi:hypothetical protein